MGKLANLIVLIAALLIILALLTKFLQTSRRQGDPAESLPYRRKDYLLSKAERSFYEVLQMAIGDMELRIFAKVRLLDLVWLPKGTTNAQAHRNRVMSKHVDFVICDPRELRPLLVIELDDASHEQQDRRARDALVDRVLGAAGLPILHLPARRTYDTRELARQIDERIRPSAQVTARA